MPDFASNDFNYLESLPGGYGGGRVAAATQYCGTTKSVFNKVYREISFQGD
jgi:hypothetical protein